MICLGSSDDIPHGNSISSLVLHILRGTDNIHLRVLMIFLMNTAFPQGTDDMPGE